MDYFFDTKRLPSFLVPFVTLSYPVNPPLKPDSFPDSAYYDIGYRDVCVVVTLIAIMAILRDAARVLILEPFANWKLTRDWRRRQVSKSGSSTPDTRASVNDPLNVNASGKVNGPVTTIGSAEKLVADRPPDKSRGAHRIRHAVIRFAEQGWQAIYYLIQWSLGIVRVTYHLRLAMHFYAQNSIFTTTYPQTSGQDILTCPSPVSSSCTTLCKYLSTSMLCFFSMLKPDEKTTGK
jgi:very-long-chain ceramide synthase